jgi:hypothetical protein
MNAIAERKNAEIEPTPAASESVALMQVIERAARDPNVDIDKMERLMSLYERRAAQEAERAFHDAMNVAQAHMQRIATDANNSQTRSRYATYAALDRALRPIYTEHGFSLSFDTGDGAPEQYVRVLAVLSHRDGHSHTYKADIPADGKGAKGGDVMTKTHAVGSAMTYGQRYLLKMIFNVAIGENDDDGNAAGVGEYVTAEQAAELTALAESVGADKIKFCQYLKVGSIAEIPAKRFDQAKKALEIKRAKA